LIEALVSLNILPSVMVISFPLLVLFFLLLLWWPTISRFRLIVPIAVGRRAPFGSSGGGGGGGRGGGGSRSSGYNDTVLKLALAAYARLLLEEADAVDALVEEGAIVKLLAVVVPLEMRTPSNF
jgi:hypothetical protein